MESSESASLCESELFLSPLLALTELSVIPRDVIILLARRGARWRQWCVTGTPLRESQPSRFNLVFLFLIHPSFFLIFVIFLAMLISSSPCTQLSFFTFLSLCLFLITHPLSHALSLTLHLTLFHSLSHLSTLILSASHHLSPSFQGLQAHPTH